MSTELNICVFSNQWALLSWNLKQNHPKCFVWLCILSVVCGDVFCKQHGLYPMSNLSKKQLARKLCHFVQGTSASHIASLTQASPFPYPWSPFTKQNSSTFPTSNSLPSPSLLATSLLQSSKTPATENSSTSGWQVLSLPHAFTNKTQAHWSLCTAIIIYIRVDNATTLAQQNADSRTEFQSPNWNPVSNQTKFFIRCLPALDWSRHLNMFMLNSFCKRGWKRD